MQWHPLADTYDAALFVVPFVVAFVTLRAPVAATVDVCASAGTCTTATASLEP